MGKSTSPKSAPKVTTRQVVKQERKSRDRSASTLERFASLDALVFGPVNLTDSNGEVVESFDNATILDSLAGIQPASIPVTIATWAKERSLSVSCRKRHDANGTFYVLTK